MNLKAHYERIEAIIRLLTLEKDQLLAAQHTQLALELAGAISRLNSELDLLDYMQGTQC